MINKMKCSVVSGRSLAAAVVAWCAFTAATFLFVGIETPVAALVASAASIVTLILLCRAIRFTPSSDNKESRK
jgi:hypothetical protein